MAAAFDAAASALNPIIPINFEGLPLQQPLSDGTSFTVSPGVTVSLTGADHSPPPGLSYGISDNPNDLTTGYNTTPGGRLHFKFVPRLNIGTATLDFAFSFPVQAFGAYLTGLGTAAGNLHVLFNDGAPHDLSVSGSASGGVQFFGFTDSKTLINSVTFQLRDVTNNSRDTFGIDDVRLIPSVPEPPSSVLIGIGLVGLITLGGCLGSFPNPFARATCKGRHETH